MSANARPSVLQLRSSAGLYGADRMVLTLNHALFCRGLRSRLLSINNYRQRDQLLYSTACSLGQKTTLLPCAGRLDLRTVGALVAAIDAGDATVLHTHDYKSAFYAWMASRTRRTRLVATLHGWADASHSMRVYNRLELALIRRFDAIVVVAHEQIERLVRAGVPLPRIHCVDNAVQAPNVLADAPASMRAASGLKCSDYVFAAVGRLAPEKNLSLLLEAFAACTPAEQPWVLLVVGDGPERSALEAQAHRLAFGDRVRFLGARTDMEHIYPLIDCLVLPSLSEGMPLVVLEAMAFGIPVIASAVGDVPRLLAHSEHGRLLPPGDPEALRAALQARCGKPRRPDQRARHYVLSEHSPETMAERYLHIYESLPATDHGRKAS